MSNIADKKRLNSNDLNKLYIESDKADSAVFADERSNILLVSGDHYTRKNARYWNRLRENRHLSQEQKVRLTKNHIQKITKTYVNNIISYAPGVAILPNNEKEAQDRKASELNGSVWEDAKKHHHLKDKILNWATDYINIGEVAVKLFWNPDKGDFIGYNQLMDNLGEPVFDEDGEPVPDEDNPEFTGNIEFERIFGFNLLRPRGADNMEDSEWLCIRKMVHVNTVKRWVKDKPDLAKKVTASTDSTFYVFEGSKNGYDKATDHALVMEFYFRPSPKYPRGYYYIAIRAGILFEGELPFGKFPIIYRGFDEIQTSPRHRSIIKQLRPYQIEINRSASKIAEHQVTLGDDKLLVQSGTKITDGINLPGVRSMQYTGRDPIILAGRSGEQYVGYMQSQIAEMYQVANLREDSAEKGKGGSSQKSNDPFGQLFMSLRDKKKFSIYSEKFERFLIDVCELYLTLAREYFDEERMIPIIGRNEYVNMSEFKNSQPLSYQINLEPRTDDLDTMMGKQLVMSQFLQYAGGQLAKEDIGKLLKNMPFANVDESFGDFTINYDMATNMILALDRGEMPEPNFYDDHKYMINKLVGRMRQADFKLLHPQIQQNYKSLEQYYGQLEVQQQQMLLAMQNEFIPTGGPSVKVDFYINMPGSDKPVRATLPTESLSWLVERLSAQGSSQEQMGTMNRGSVQTMAQQLLQQRRGKPAAS